MVTIDWSGVLEKRPSERTVDEVDAIFSQIKDTVAFDKYHPSLLRQICSYGYYEDMEKGVIIFRQGDRGRNWYTVLSGSLDVVVSRSGSFKDCVKLHRLEEGSSFGDSVLGETPHGVAVVTAEATELLRVEQQDFLALWKKNKRIMEGLLSSDHGSNDQVAGRLPKGSAVLPTKYTTNNNISLPETPEVDDDVTSDVSHLGFSSPIIQVASARRKRAALVICTYLCGRTTLIRNHKLCLRTFENCVAGSELVHWALQYDNIVHTRLQAIGVWQALLEEGLLSPVNNDFHFKDDSQLLYQFIDTKPDATSDLDNGIKSELQEALRYLAQVAADALMRMICRKESKDRSPEELQLVYEESLHIKALSHLSTMVKRQLAYVLMFESHTSEGDLLFSQGDEGKSWYIILKGSVNVVIHGKGVVCTLNEGDDFGKLALVNDAPRAATIILRENNCHFLRVDKDDFNRILTDVEANTVRLKEHEKEVLVLEQIPSVSAGNGLYHRQHSQYKYSVMAGTPEKILDYLLESRLEKNDDRDDTFLEDYLLTHAIYVTHKAVCDQLMEHFHSSLADAKMTEKERATLVASNKRRVIQFVENWVTIAGDSFFEDTICNNFMKELHHDIERDNQVHKCKDSSLVTIRRLMHNISNNEGEPKFIYTPSINPNASPKLSPRSGKRTSMEAEPLVKAIKAHNEILFRVYCPDHTYTTLKTRMDATVTQIIKSAAHKLSLGPNLVLCEVKSSGDRTVFSSDDIGVFSDLSPNGQLFIVTRDRLDTLVPLSEQQMATLSATKDLEHCSARELAYHLTIYHWHLFSCLHEQELVYQVFGRKLFQKITANLQEMVRHFIQVQHWVMTEICLSSSTQRRVSLLRKFIKVAAHCKESCNLYGFFAIVMGLSNSVINRLEQSWERLPNKFQKMYSDFEVMLDPSRNHRAYRQTLAKLKPPVIPFIPLLLKDMTFTNDGNKTYFQGLVNFEKMRMLAMPLRTIRWCKSKNLELEAPVAQKSPLDLCHYVRNLSVIDNQRLLNKLSHELEPRRST